LITSRGSGNFKLPLLFIIMLLPLVFYGGGRISFDHLLLKMTGRNLGVDDRLGDASAAGLAFLVLAVSTVVLEPSWGITFLVLAILSSAIPAFFR
jgi:putative oxidoreductase